MVEFSLQVFRLTAITKVIVSRLINFICTSVNKDVLWQALYFTIMDPGPGGRRERHHPWAVRPLRLAGEIVSGTVGLAVVAERAAEDVPKLGLGVAVVHFWGQYDAGDGGTSKTTAAQKIVPQGKAGDRARGLGQQLRADVQSLDAGANASECLSTDPGYLCRNNEGARGECRSVQKELNIEECLILDRFKILRKR